MTAKAKLQNDESPAWARWFVWGVLGGAGILALSAFMLTADRAQDVARFTAQGWPVQYAGVIVENKIRALWHAAFMTFCAGGALWFFVGKGRSGVRRQEAGGRSQKSEARGQEAGGRRQRAEGRGLEEREQRSEAPLNTEHRTLNTSSVVGWLLVLLVAFDAWLLSRHYVKTMPMSALDENPVISILKKDMPERRVALVTQEGFYNWWLTYLFPYHGILTVNITQMPRMPIDYKNYLDAVGRNPLRYWQTAAVGYVLAPAQVWSQIQRDPAWSNALELVYSYNVAPADPQRMEAGFMVYPATAQYPGQHVVMRLTRPAPRFALIGKARETGDDEALKLLGSPAWPLFEEVLLSPAQPADTPAGSTGSLTNAGIVGACRLVNYRPGRMELDVRTDLPAVLRVSEKYDKDWKAWIDGTPSKVRRIDYIFQGVYVPAGNHRVILKYAPSVWPLYVQGAGLLIVLGAMVWLVIDKIRGRAGARSGSAPEALEKE